MGKLGLSATEIGVRIGATAIETNLLLRNQGFFRGGPGAYALTPMGARFGVETNHDNGYGGVARREWGITHFNPNILEVLDSTVEELTKVRIELAARKQDLKAAKIIAEAAAAAAAHFEAFQAKNQASEFQHEIDPRKALVVAAGALVITGTAIGVYKGIRWYKRKKASREALNNASNTTTGDETSKEKS